jgi:hypothetical protein
MDERGGLQRLARALVCKLLRGQFAQLAVNQRPQPRCGVRFTMLDGQ